MGEHLVFIVDSDFMPHEVRAIVGDHVTWENRTDVDQSATRTDDPQFDTGTIKPGERSDPMELTASGNLTYFTNGPRGFEGRLIVND